LIRNDTPNERKTDDYFFFGIVIVGCVCCFNGGSSVGRSTVPSIFSTFSPPQPVFRVSISEAHPRNINGINPNTDFFMIQNSQVVMMPSLSGTFETKKLAATGLPAI
jgi:hypothetical protein